MKFSEYLIKLNYVIELANKNSTGTPKALAKKLSVSERTIFRIVQSIKEQKINIEYCRHRDTYVIND